MYGLAVQTFDKNNNVFLQAPLVVYKGTCYISIVVHVANKETDMAKVIIIVLTALVGLALLLGCNRQPAISAHTEPLLFFEPFDGQIIEYLPITLNDRFELSAGWFRRPGKTDFTNQEFAIISSALESLTWYGYTHPYDNEQTYGGPIILHVTSEKHETVISFISHSSWNNLAMAVIDNDPATRQWFTVDLEAFNALTRFADWIWDNY